MITTINEYRQFINENNEPIAPNHVEIFFYDWKEQPSREDVRRMAAIAQATGGMYDELDVHTADSKIYAAGPMSLFDWVSANSDYGDAQEIFGDAEMLYDENDEDVDQVTNWYMNNDELWVKTMYNGDMSFADWYAMIEASYPTDESLKESVKLKRRK